MSVKEKKILRSIKNSNPALLNSSQLHSLEQREQYYYSKTSLVQSLLSQGLHVMACCFIVCCQAYYCGCCEKDGSLWSRMPLCMYNKSVKSLESMSMQFPLHFSLTPSPLPTPSHPPHPQLHHHHPHTHTLYLYIPQHTYMCTCSNGV